MTKNSEEMDQFLSSINIPCDDCGDIMCNGFCPQWYAKATESEKIWASEFDL